MSDPTTSDPPQQSEPSDPAARDDDVVGRDEWGDEADEALADAKPSQRQATESPDQQAAPRTESE